LRKKWVDLPQPSTSYADVALAQEIRQCVRGQKSPIDVAVKSMRDTEFNLVRERARTALHPEQVQMQKSFKRRSKNCAKVLRH
jgi:hypothetical protein